MVNPSVYDPLKWNPFHHLCLQISARKKTAATAIRSENQQKAPVRQFKTHTRYDLTPWWTYRRLIIRSLVCGGDEQTN
ncbi:hypothetical protein HanIR_Chr13g0636011 [Helianthus annuus]|nr:hypothetical protein HanIR_Chr13g0636011 [Helianthus annuus]